MDPIRRLAEFTTELQWDDLPPEVVEHSRRVLLDTLGTTLGGSVEPEVIAMARRYGRPDGGPSTLIGHGLRSSPLNASLVNGTSACWMDFDSGHRPPPGKPLLPAAHPPIHLVPAALATAEKEEATGRELLTALVVGYDAGARIGMSSRVRPEIHCHGTHHNVAAAVAAARLMKYSADQMASTIGLAAHLSLMPSFENAYQGGTVRNTYAGVGAAAGVLAAELASVGFTAEKDVLSSVYGGVISSWFDPDLVTEDLGKRFEITLGFIKLYPMCRFGHPAIEATQKLIDQYPSIQPDEIEEIEVHTFDWAATLNEKNPRTDLAAKFSIPWAVASMMVRGSAGPDQFRTEALKDGAVRALAGKVAVREDTQYSIMTPVKRPARIIVKIKGGNTFQAEVERSSGGPEAPLPREKVIEKFRFLADPILSPEPARAVVEKVMHLERASDIRSLTKLLTPGAHGQGTAAKA